MEDYDVAVISYTAEDAPDVTFRWHGGAYIDVCGPDGQAYDVINVWNDADGVSYLEQEAASSPRPFRATLEAFEARCASWLAEDIEAAEIDA